MAVDNRTELDGMNAVGTWSGSATLTADTAVKYQGTGALRTQSTNAYRSWTDSIASTDLSAKTIYFMVLIGAVDTKANGGIRFLLGDGTNTRAYYVGGSDDLGMGVQGGFRVYRLDTANLPASFSQDAGAAAPTLTAITSIGIGTLQSAKATGNSDNTWFDRIAYIANGSAALTINAGTVGTPIDFATLASDDITNGWGLIAQPIAGSSLFQVYGALEFGNTTLGQNTYFDDSDVQVFLDGSGLSANTMDVDFISNTTGTNSLVLNNVLFVAVNEPSNWNFDSTNFDIQKLDGCQFINMGTIAFHATQSASNRWVKTSSFINCEQVSPKQTTFEDNVFSASTDAGGAMLYPTVDTYIKNIDFINCTVGVEHATNADVTYDNFTFTGCTNDINNSANATSIDSHLTGTNNYSVGAGVTNQRRAIEFTSGSAQDLSHVEFELKKVGSPTGNAVAKLYAGGGSTPGALLATSQNFNVSTLTTGYQTLVIEFPAAQQFALSASTNYWISFEYAGGDVSNYVDMEGASGAAGENSAVYAGSWATSTEDIQYRALIGVVNVSATNGSNPSTYTATGTPPSAVTIANAVNLTITVINRKTKAVIENAQTSMWLISDRSQLMNEDTNASGVATEAYNYSGDVQAELRVRKSEDTDNPRYLPFSDIVTITANGYSRTVQLSESNILN